MIAARQGGAPGETIDLAVYQRLDPGWHVYWQNPGDSGLPLSLDWSLPDGFEASEPLYPLPHRLSLGTLVNYGHEDEAVFVVPLSLAEDAEPGRTVPLSVEASWLICSDICIPESATLTLDLPITDAPAPPERRYGGLIEEARAVHRPAGSIAARYADDGTGPVLILPPDLEAPEFFPYEANLVEPAGRHEVTDGDGETRIALDPGFAYLDAPPESLDGLLVTGSDDRRVGTPISAARTGEALSVAPPALTSDVSARRGRTPGLGAILMLAFLGGLVLNVMPCVFPIVFLKASQLARAAQADRTALRREAGLYTAGVLVSFAVMAGLLFALRAGGAAVGWGFHLQNPVVIGLFAVLIFLIGLNLLGAFEVGTSVQGRGQSLAERGGDLGAFFTGVLAVLVAAPCIGPFLGVPVGVALTQPAALGVSVFLAIGLGLALPYLLISLLPGLARSLPRPGPWMTTLRQLFAFAMFATLVWLAWVLSVQAGPNGVLTLGIALVLAGLAGWAFGRGQAVGGRAFRIVAAAALLLAIVPIVRLSAADAAPRSSEAGSVLDAAPYDEAVLSSLRERGTPVFVDFTAAWCVTCQVNKQTVLNRDAVVAAFEASGTRYMVADWTVPDPVITAALERQGRSGVPLYLYYAPGADAPRILPQMLSVNGVVAVLEGRES
nr:protein-disulfide reductase DsbD domain-containing protein [Parvularcula dongshanensis]